MNCANSFGLISPRPLNRVFSDLPRSFADRASRCWSEPGTDPDVIFLPRSVPRCQDKRLGWYSSLNRSSPTRTIYPLNWLLFLLFLSPACRLAAGELSVVQRIEPRSFPSVFQAWNGATPLAGRDADAMLAKHDLAFLHPGTLGLVSSNAFEGMAHTFTATSLDSARRKRTDLLALNSNLVLLAEVRYRDAPTGFLPEDSPWWKRDDRGQFILGWAEGGYRLLDVPSPDWHTQVAKRARALVRSGVFDGVMLDWWIDDDARTALIQQVREAIGPEALILVNANDRVIPRTAPYVNGLFMECYRSKTAADWQRISDTLRWAEINLRPPRINCVETWFHKSRADDSLMRAVTTLTLTQSDGYCLFSDPNDLPTPDHLHDWYPFWNRGLGRPKTPGFKRVDGAWERDFSGGTVVYNPSGNSSVTVHFDAAHSSRTTGRSGTEHTVPPNDGDTFLPD